MIGTKIPTTARYDPLPWQYKPLRDKSKILLLTGSAGGGKSRCAGEKMVAYCVKYPGAMALMVRKTRESMTNSTVLFVERTVLQDARGVRHFPSKNRFEFVNGSILAYGGMADEKQREQIRSIGQDGSLDIVWMEEANKFFEEDYQEVVTRLRGKAADWRQVILTTNPDAPNHWIHKRLMLGKEATVFYSGALDNPYNPADYLETLGLLVGVQAQRLRLGQWVQAEGAVYPTFGPENIVLEEPDWERPVELGFDDGYAVDPRAILFVQRWPDHILVFDEIYDLQKLEEESVSAVLEKCAQYAGKGTPDDKWGQMSLGEKARWMHGQEIPLPEIAVGSTEAAQLMRRFQMANIPARGGTHTPMTEGVKLVRGLVQDAKGRSVLRVNRRCKRFIEEMQGYQMDANKDRPQDKDDHGPDAIRYWAWLRARAFA